MSFQGLSVAIETVRIDKELMEIWPNEVCDTITLTLTPKNVNLAYNIEHPFRSLILISEDSPGGELYHNYKL